ncbi:hypothetical protein LT493_09230 [Streptomyces tricolor]|nr:hypothetical protein [Streptomyces tricolor]
MELLDALPQTRLSAGTAPVPPAVALVTMGIGWAGVLSPATVSALSAVPERQAGLAVGSSWTFHNLGGAIGLAACVVLFRTFASGRLTTELTRRHQATGDWTDSVVTNPRARHRGPGRADLAAGRRRGPGLRRGLQSRHAGRHVAADRGLRAGRPVRLSRARTVPGAPRARGTVRAVRRSQRTCSRVTRVVRPAHTARTTPTQRRRSSR